MSAMPSHTQPGLSAALLVRPSVDADAGSPVEVKNDQLPTSRLSLGNRASLAFAYYMIVFSIGIAATLAWQIYGDAARQLIAPAASAPISRSSTLYRSISMRCGEVSTGSPLASALLSPPAKSRQRATSISLRPAWSR